jgi:hypothetical protein
MTDVEHEPEAREAALAVDPFDALVVQQAVVGLLERIAPITHLK